MSAGRVSGTAGLLERSTSLSVSGRQDEAVRLLRDAAQRLWPETMAPGRLTRFGTRKANEVYLVLSYDTWADQAEPALIRTASNPRTTTGDTIRAVVPVGAFDPATLS